jgi:hypothetical protein
VTSWWDDLNDPDPSMSRQDIIAWQITTSYSDTKHAHVSSAEPICPDFILNPDFGDAAIVGPRGTVMVIAHEDYPSIEDWIEARKDERKRDRDRQKLVVAG